MAKKIKRPPFKKGDPVLYLDGQLYYNKVHVTEAQVTAIRSDNDHFLVYTKHEDQWKNEWRRCFTTNVLQRYQEDPYPIWQLIPHPGKEAIKRIKKRLEQANKKREKWYEQLGEISRDVDREAREWRDDEEKRRVAELPNMQHHVERVISRSGFKKPKVAG